MKKKVIHNGRADKVREFLATHDGWFTTRQITDSASPGCNSTLMGGTLNSLWRGGYIRKEGDGTYGSCRWARATGPRSKPATPATTRKRTTAAETGPRERKHAGMALLDRAARRAKAAQDAKLAAQAMRLKPRTPAANTPETVEEFIARGGQIQQLHAGASATPLSTPMSPAVPKRVGIVYPKRGMHA